MLAIVLSSIVLSACASNKAPETQHVASSKDQEKLDVLYTTGLPDGGHLKEVPTEVTIVKRRATEKNVATQIGLNVLLFALGGGGTIQPFSKEDLKGARIEDLGDRKNLANPVSTEFVNTLQDDVNSAILKDATLKKKISQKELMVSGGSSRLVYEKLAGKNEEQFRLKTELYVLAKEKGFHLNFHTPKMVTCSENSNDLLTQAQWAENGYQLVKADLDTTLQACEKKVLANLSTLLTD